MPAGQPGGEVIDDSQQLSAVVLELAPGPVQRERQAADLSLADGVLTAGRGGQFAPAEAARTLPVRALRAAWWSASSPASRSARSLLACAVRAAVISCRATSRMRSASRSNAGTRHRQPARLQAQRG